MIDILYKNLLYHNMASFIFIFINIFIHFTFMRLMKFRYFISILIGFLIGLLLLIYFEINFIFINEYSLFYSFNNLIIYLLLSFFYFAVLSTSKTSIRLRILHEINQNNGLLEKSDLIKKYNTKEIINIRLKRMLQNKQILIKNNRLFSKFSITLFIGIMLDIVKLILFGSKKCNLINNFKVDDI